MDDYGPAYDVSNQLAIHVVDHADEDGDHRVRWSEPGDTATVAGRDIGGMVYVALKQRQPVRGLRPVEWLERGSDRCSRVRVPGGTAFHCWGGVTVRVWRNR